EGVGGGDEGDPDQRVAHQLLGEGRRRAQHVTGEDLEEHQDGHQREQDDGGPQQGGGQPSTHPLQAVGAGSCPGGWTGCGIGTGTEAHEVSSEREATRVRTSSTSGYSAERLSRTGRVAARNASRSTSSTNSTPIASASSSAAVMASAHAARWSREDCSAACASSSWSA